MRVLSPIILLAGVLITSSACSNGAPFNKISSVKVRHIGAGGLKDKVFEGKTAESLVKCLYKTTETVEENTKQELLQTTYLIEISDNLGDRSFELYTMENLKGNKGKYYVNRCLYGLIQAAK